MCKGCYQYNLHFKKYDYDFSGEPSPTAPHHPTLSYPEIPTLDTEALGFDNEDFFDDDFGLSDAAMRQKAEMLRLQQLKEFYAFDYFIL